MSTPTHQQELDEWCRRWLRSPADRVLFRSGNLAAVTGLRLRDGRLVVVKARRPLARLDGCLAAQQHLADAGFPCPAPLAGPAPMGSLVATAEEYRPGGRQLRHPGSAPHCFGRALADLVSAAPPVSSIPSLEPPPAWLRWDHAQPGLWPVPESTPVDLNLRTGPSWLDEAAQRARTRLWDATAPAVVAHGDFESQNVRWRGRRLHLVHDWDSTVGLPEAVVAGAAAAMFPATGPRAAIASISAGTDFLYTYSRHRHRPWTSREWQVCWAAGLWVLAYNAKVEVVEGREALVHRLLRDVERRLGLAGV